MAQNNLEFKLSSLQQSEEDDWERLVATSSLASIYHTLEWKRILEQSFGFKAHYITVHLKGEMVDGMPLFLIKKPFLGEKIVSVPHCGGHHSCLSGNRVLNKYLVDHAIGLAKTRQSVYLELRSCADLKMTELEVRHPVVFPVVPLLEESDNLKRMSENHRRSIRRAGKEGVSVFAASQYEELRLFYTIMAAQSQRFGSPMFPFKYFDALWREFEPGKYLQLLLIVHKGKVIGGGVFFIYKNKMMYKYGACDISSMHLRPFHAMLWHAIQLGLQQGLTELDLGAASCGDNGLLRFKRHWGAEMHTAYFHYLALLQNIPKVEDYFDSYVWQKKIWRRLPRNVVNLIGPRVLEWVC